MSSSENRYLVVMAGGSGTRFWPKSTSRRPKQLLAFGKSSQPLISLTLDRFSGVVEDERRWILTTASLQNSVREAAPHARILAEPQGRNTAPCIYWAARELEKISPDTVMLVMPSDHFVAKLPAFRKTVEQACRWAAEHDDLVTLGIRPSRPETGYGYLKLGKKVRGGTCLEVDAFVEKPDLPRAKRFVSSRKYLWNGGMFVWKVSTILAAFDRTMPEMRVEWERAGGDPKKAYPKLTATSIDFGVMERAEKVVTFPLDCGWDDLGNWTSLEGLGEVLGARASGGVVTAGELLSIESEGNIVDAPGKLVALLGVDDLIVAESGSSILVANKARAQDIRKVVERLKKSRPDLV